MLNIELVIKVNKKTIIYASGFKLPDQNAATKYDVLIEMKQWIEKHPSYYVHYRF